MDGQAQSHSISLSSSRRAGTRHSLKDNTSFFASLDQSLPSVSLSHWYLRHLPTFVLLESRACVSFLGSHGNQILPSNTKAQLEEIKYSALEESCFEDKDKDL